MSAINLTLGAPNLGFIYLPLGSRHVNVYLGWKIRWGWIPTLKKRIRFNISNWRNFPKWCLNLDVSMGSYLSCIYPILVIHLQMATFNNFGGTVYLIVRSLILQASLVALGVEFSITRRHTQSISPAFLHHAAKEKKLAHLLVRGRGKELVFW